MTSAVHSIYAAQINQTSECSHTPASESQQDQVSTSQIVYEPCVRPSGMRKVHRDAEAHRTEDKAVQTTSQQEVLEACDEDPSCADVNDQSNEEVHTDFSEPLCSSGEERIAVDPISRTHSQDSLNSWPPRSPARGRKDKRCCAEIQQLVRDKAKLEERQRTPDSSSSYGDRPTMPTVNWALRTAAVRPRRFVVRRVLRIHVSSLVVYVMLVTLALMFLEWVFLADNGPRSGADVRYLYRPHHLH